MCPTYGWSCATCSKITDVVASSKDDVVPNYKTPPTRCAHCDERAPEAFTRHIGTDSAQFVLKGDGWHRDEYSRTGKSIK